MAGNTATPRERYRRQVREEIKARAWEQIATAGTSALSLNAIAKQVGMSGPALYRYFAGRDELITELVRDAYRSLADAFLVTADSGTGAGPGPHTLAALAHTVRRWALADPQRYFLVYGTPVPGYHAPQEVTAIAQEMMAVLLDACAATGPADAADEAAADFDAHLAEYGGWAAGRPDTPPAVLRLSLTFWTRVHGVLSLELAGHFTGMGFDPAQHFAAEVATFAPTPR